MNNNRESEAEIHHFDGSNAMLIDCDGDVMLGWFYQLGIAGLMGPYGSQGEAEVACQNAFDTGDY